MNYKNVFEELNNLRRKTLLILTVFYGGIFLITLLVLSLSTQFIGQLGPQIIPLLFLPFLIVIFGHKRIIKKYRFVFKQKVLPIAFEKFGEDLQFYNDGIAKEVAKKTDMFGYFTVYKSEDLIKGKIEGVGFQSSDVKLGYYTGGKNRRYVPVCHGQLYIFEFNKTFKSTTIIREKMRSKPSGFDRVKLENQLFNDKFYIYSNNKHDAYYILTPTFMEQLILLEKNHPGNIYMAFYNNQLHIGIDNRTNQFEPPLLEIIKEDTITNIINDLNLIKNIILDLKLNNDLFKIEGNNYDSN